MISIASGARVSLRVMLLPNGLCFQSLDDYPSRMKANLDLPGCP